MLRTFIAMSIPAGAYSFFRLGVLSGDFLLIGNAALLQFPVPFSLENSLLALFNGALSHIEYEKGLFFKLKRWFLSFAFVSSRLYQVCKLMLFASTSGLYSCPLAMTDGAIKILKVIYAVMPTLH